MGKFVSKTNFREDARLSLINAGLYLFGEYGFKAATTRMIADEANVNISAIGYYYGGKKELYHAVVEYILAQITHHFEGLQFNVQSAAQEEIKSEEALQMMDIIISSMVKLFIESDKTQKWSRIIMREQANPTEAFDILYEGNIKKMQDIFAKIIAAYTGLKEGSDETKMIAHTIYGQIIGFVVGRESILRSLKVKKMNQKYLDIISNILRRNIEASLVFARKEVA